MSIIDKLFEFGPAKSSWDGEVTDQISKLLDKIETDRKADTYKENIAHVSFAIYKSESNYHSYDDYNEEEQQKIMDDFVETYDEYFVVKELWEKFIKKEKHPSEEQFLLILGSWMSTMRYFQ